MTDRENTQDIKQRSTHTYVVRGEEQKGSQEMNKNEKNERVTQTHPNSRDQRTQGWE